MRPSAKVAIVGEALGKDELAEQQYFVGKCGKLHFEPLTKLAGLHRNEIHLTNVIKEQPPKTARKSNDISVFVDLSKPQVEETPLYQEYKNELQQELTWIQPNIVVALGAVAAYTLIGQPIKDYGIRRCRGGLYESSLIPGLKVLCTLHPAALLYGNGSYGDFSMMNQLDRMLILWDLQRAKENENFADIRLPKRKLLVKPTFTEAIEYLDYCYAGRECAFDIESIGTHMNCFAVSPNKYESMCIPLMEGKDEYFNPEQELQITLKLAEILELKRIRKTIHNAAFDVKFMFRRYGIRTQNYFCTMIAQNISMPDFHYPKQGKGKDLGTVISIYCDGEQYYKDDGKTLFKDDAAGLRQANYDYTTFWQYNNKDAVNLHVIREKQLMLLAEQNNMATFERQMAMVDPAIYMGDYGQLVDVDGLVDAQPLVQNRIGELKEKFAELAGWPINTGSNVQLKKLFYEQLKVRPFVKTNENGVKVVTCDAKAIERIAIGGGNANGTAQKAAKLLHEIRRLSTLMSKYLTTLAWTLEDSPDNRLHYDFNVAGTQTGRFSSDADLIAGGQNVQNVAKDDYEV